MVIQNRLITNLPVPCHASGSSGLIGYVGGNNSPCTRVWLWRLMPSAFGRVDSVLATAKSRPNVTMVSFKVRTHGEISRERRNADNAS